MKTLFEIKLLAQKGELQITNSSVDSQVFIQLQLKDLFKEKFCIMDPPGWASLVSREIKWKDKRLQKTPRCIYFKLGVFITCLSQIESIIPW